MPTNDESGNTRQKVIDWLERLPGDNPKDQPEEADFSYDAWFEEGRATPNAVEELMQLLNEEDLSSPSALAGSIAYALGWVGNETAVQALTRALDSDDALLQSEAIAALGKLRAVEIFDRISGYLKDTTQDPNLRGNASIALGNMAHPESENVLSGAKDDEDEFVALCVIEGLRLLHEGGI